LVIIGDPLSISGQQAKEHGLMDIRDIKDSFGNIIFKVYKAGYVID
jgi:hypothetical protein